MAVEIQSGTALAEALQSVVGPKLAEAGWTSGAVDDNSLTEYIILMLINGKTQEQIASELAADLLGLPPDEPSTHEFARWLFEQVHTLNAQINGGAAPQQAQQQPSNMAISHPVAAPETNGFGASQDTAMGDGGEGPSDGAMYVYDLTGSEDKILTEQCRPTGPRSMRNGSMSNNGRGGRGGRMLGQLNKAMDRKSSDTSLHKIRGAANSGRINTHANREAPKGPRNMNNRMQTALNPRPGMGMAGMNPAMMQNMMAADPQQQMQLLKLLEEQSRMMAEILGPGANAPAINPAFFPGAQQQTQQQTRSGKSLFERVDRKGSRQNTSFGKNKLPRQDAMDTGDAADGQGTGTDEHKDPSQLPCYWQLECTKPTCQFGHQSPAAPAGITTDLSDKCSYGAACQNKKCAASHPSPAKRLQHLSTTVVCSFYPNCKLIPPRVLQHHYDTNTIFQAPNLTVLSSTQTYHPAGTVPIARSATQAAPLHTATSNATLIPARNPIAPSATPKAKKLLPLVIKSGHAKASTGLPLKRNTSPSVSLSPMTASRN